MRTRPTPLVLGAGTAVAATGMSGLSASGLAAGLTAGVVVGVAVASVATVTASRRTRRDASAERGRRTRRDTATGLLTVHAAGVEHDARPRSEHTHLLLLVVVGLRALLRDLPATAAAELATSLAARVDDATSSPQVVCRGDADELVVLFDGDTGLAESLARDLARPLALASNGTTVTPQVRAGVCEVDGGVPLRVLLDRARYAAARAVVDGPATTYDRGVEDDRRRRAEIAAALPRAIANGEIEPWFQPIVEVRTGRIRGFETLARWRHAELGPISPGEFIPLAESTGAILELGTRLLHEAIAHLSVWREERERDDLYVSVNVSARQLGHDAAAIIGAALRATGLPPDRLVVELTESVLVEDAEQATSELGRIRDLGVRLAVDDFGTGYSSLAYLQRFRPDVVKIDRSFTQRLGGPEGDVAAGVFAMLDELGWDVIAEGIEEQQTAAILAALNCEVGQGWLWSPAVPARLVPRLLDAVPDGTDGIPRPRATTALPTSLPPDHGGGGGRTIEDLLEPAVVVDASTSCLHLERLFQHTTRLGSVVVRREDEVGILTAARFHAVMAGPYGFGRSVHARRTVGDVLDHRARAMASGTQLVDAAAVALARAEDERYEDLVVEHDGELALLSIGKLLEAMTTSLTDQANQDPLTGLPNRRHFHAMLDRAIAAREPIGLLFIDLDRFKPVNDDHGHAAGDAVLEAVAQRLRACARPRDVVARLGGDEFAVLVAAGTEELCHTIGERIQQALTPQIEWGAHLFDVGASIGVAAGVWDDADAMLHAADESMYVAKRQGGDRLVTATPLVAPPSAPPSPATT